MPHCEGIRIIRTEEPLPSCKSTDCFYLTATLGKCPQVTTHFLKHWIERQVSAWSTSLRSVCSFRHWTSKSYTINFFVIVVFIKKPPALHIQIFVWKHSVPLFPLSEVGLPSFLSGVSIFSRFLFTTSASHLPMFSSACVAGNVVLKMTRVTKQSLKRQAPRGRSENILLSHLVVFSNVLGIISNLFLPYTTKSNLDLRLNQPIVKLVMSLVIVRLWVA